MASGAKLVKWYGGSNSIADRLGRSAYEKLWGGSALNGNLAHTSWYEYNGVDRFAGLYANWNPGANVQLARYSSGGDYPGYDRFGRVVSQAWKRYTTGALLDQVDYTYDYAGNRLSRNIPSSLYSTDDRDQAYTYDGLHRLKTFDEGTLSGTPPSISSPAREQDWGLDQLGNWATFDEKASGSYTLQQERYHNAVNEIDGNGGDPITLQAGGAGSNWADPVHDKAGIMTTMPQPADPTSTFTLTYDAWNRLVSVGQEPYFEYDGLGRRIVNEDQATSRHYYYNEQWQMLEERVTGYDDRVCQYVWHTYYIDALAVRYYDPGTTGSFDAHYYCQDANFNVTAVTDDSGDVLERYNYTPYGEVTFLNPNFTPITGNVTQIGNTHLYTGRERDPETGLQLNRHRY